MKLTKPKNQNAEVLFELITQPKINRIIIMQRCGVLNLTARIDNLKNKFGVNIVCSLTETKNKHNRKVKFGNWLIPKLDLESAKEIYCKLNK